MEWTWLIFLIPITIMVLVGLWALKQKQNYHNKTKSELTKLYKNQQQKIEIGVGIFSVIMVVFFGLDLLGPQTSGTGKVLAPVNLNVYQIRLNGGLPINIDQQAVLLQKWGDRNNTSFVTSPDLIRKIIATNGQPFNVNFKQTFILGNITEVTVNGQTFSISAGNLTVVGLIAFSFLMVITLGGNYEIILKFFRSRKRLT